MLQEVGAGRVLVGQDLGAVLGWRKYGKLTRRLLSSYRVWIPRIERSTLKGICDIVSNSDSEAARPVKPAACKSLNERLDSEPGRLIMPASSVHRRNSEVLK